MTGGPTFLPLPRREGIEGRVRQTAVLIISKTPFVFCKTSIILFTPEDFEKRFLDVKAQEDKDRLLQLFKSLRKRKKESIQSLNVLRQLRGYSANP